MANAIVAFRNILRDFAKVDEPSPPPKRPSSDVSFAPEVVFLGVGGRICLQSEGVRGQIRSSALPASVARTPTRVGLNTEIQSPLNPIPSHRD